MKIKLNLHERLMFLNLLPTENNFTTLRIIRKVKKEVGLTEEEYKKYEIKPNEDGKTISFNPVKASERKEFEIGEIAFILVKEALEKLDKEKKLTNEHIDIYDKIVNFEEDKEEKENKPSKK